MSQEQLKAFMEKAKEDIELQKKLIALAVEHGFSVTTNDLCGLSSELDDCDLDNVAGGSYTNNEVHVDFSGW